MTLTCSAFHDAEQFDQGWKDLRSSGWKALQELKGVAIPIRIGGTFSEPTWTPDLGAAVGDTVKKKARKEIEKKSRDLLKDKLDDQLLKGLFK